MGRRAKGAFVGGFLALTTVVGLASADGTRPQTTVRTPGTWRTSPASPERINHRLDELAAAYDHVPRVVLFDIAYPSDEDALAGHALLLVTAVSQKKEELPLKRVYVVRGADEVELKTVKTVLSSSPNSSDPVARALGAYRADALYLLPIRLPAVPGALLVDFAEGRSAMKVAEFGDALPPAVARLTANTYSGHGIAADALDTFMRREFPGFFRE